MLRNPMTRWAALHFRHALLRLRRPDLRLGYMAWFDKATFGEHVQLGKESSVHDVEIGRMSYVGAEARVTNASIGSFTSIGPGVMIGLGRHPVDTFVSTHPAFYSPAWPLGADAKAAGFTESKRIRIGSDVWIGARALVLDGLEVGHGAIIGAGAVVTRDVPPYAIVAGVPARQLRYRFAPRQVERLLAAAWWDRPEAWLAQHHARFRDVDGFLDAEDSDAAG